jgi:hypothetical protein
MAPTLANTYFLLNVVGQLAARIDAVAQVSKGARQEVIREALTEYKAN